MAIEDLLKDESAEGEQTSFFQMISDAGERRYGNENARRIYEELGLSAVSTVLYRTHGVKVSKVPMLRHTLIYGGSETFKSQMISDFIEHFLPSDLPTGEVDYATPRSLMGSIDRNSGDIYTPAFTTNEFTLVEWDTLSDMDSSSEMKGIFYKVLEDGVLRNSMVSTAKADTDDGEVYGGTLGKDVRIDNFALEFDVHSVVIGTVHTGSDFWNEYDEAFYNRWLPIFNDPPDSYVGDARRNEKLLDEDEKEIQAAFNQLLSEEFTTAFKSVKRSAYDNVFGDHLEAISPRLFNKMNVTVSCKALLEGHYKNGEVQPTPADEQWMKERMQTVYGPHYREMWSYTETNTTNTKRRNDKLEMQKDIILYLVENDGATKRQICQAFKRPEGTIERWLSSRDDLFELLTMNVEETEDGLTKPVYRVNGIPDGVDTDAD